MVAWVGLAGMGWDGMGGVVAHVMAFFTYLGTWLDLGFLGQGPGLGLGLDNEKQFNQSQFIGEYLKNHCHRKQLGSEVYWETILQTLIQIIFPMINPTNGID